MKADGGKSLLRDLQDLSKQLDKAMGYAKETDTIAWVRGQVNSLSEDISKANEFRIVYQRHSASQSQCFVVTATFGDPSDDTVASLRCYRDLVLSDSYLGRLFIRVYYRIGPILATCVEKLPSTRIILQPFLRWIARRLTHTKAFQAAQGERDLEA